MVQLFYDFLGLSDPSWLVEFVVVCCVSFMGIWLVCNFVNLLISNIFNLFK